MVRGWPRAIEVGQSITSRVGVRVRASGRTAVTLVVRRGGRLLPLAALEHAHHHSCRASEEPLELGGSRLARIRCNIEFARLGADLIDELEGWLGQGRACGIETISVLEEDVQYVFRVINQDVLTKKIVSSTSKSLLSCMRRKSKTPRVVL